MNISPWANARGLIALFGEFDQFEPQYANEAGDQTDDEIDRV